MGLPSATSLSGLVGATSIALFSAQLYPRDTNHYLPVLSELVCWTLLLAFVRFLPSIRYGIWKDGGALHAPSQQDLWVIATSIAVSTLSFSFQSNPWVFPAVTLALHVLRRISFLPPSDTYPESRPPVRVILGLIISIVALAPLPSVEKLAYGTLCLVSHAVLYAYLIRIVEGETAYNETVTQTTLNQVIHVLALRTTGALSVAILLLSFILQPGLTPAFFKTIISGCAKAAHWAAMFRLTQEVPWEAATTIWTCAAGTQEAFAPSTQTSFDLIRTVVLVVVSMSAVHHTVMYLPKTSNGRIVLYIFAMWPMFSLLNLATLSTRIPGLPGEIWTSPSLEKEKPARRHPIERLMAKAEADFTLRIEKQSKTLIDAEKEYSRRYSRDPPPGFARWFEYAQAKGSLIIDDFDMIYNDLQPFLQVSPQRMREGIDHVTSFEHLALRKCGFTNGEYHGQGGGWIVEDLGRLLIDVSHHIPDVEFAFDVVDEPRVVITQQMLDSGGSSTPEFVDESHKSIWRRVTAACPSLKSSKSTIHDFGIPFVQVWADAKDVCQHPEFERMHGFFSSPATCMLTDAPIPVLSQAAPSSFGDIMYPSPWYTEKEDQGNYKEEDDPPWDQKSDTLYWAGSTTGSHSTNHSWKFSHRQRFVELVQTLDQTKHMYMKQLKPGVWGSYEAVEELESLFDVKLTAIIQCDDADCQEQKDFFQLSNREEGNRQFQSRFVFDIDGNSFSGRYYTLLRSRSAVLKQTVLREWHDERLVPWVHYIPVSLSMGELPEIMRYFTADDEGRRRAKDIADAGREWHGRVLRRDDFTVYLFRLMLELARVMDPKRDV